MRRWLGRTMSPLSRRNPRTRGTDTRSGNAAAARIRAWPPRAMSHIAYTTGRVMADLFVTKLIPPPRVDIQRQSAQGNNIVFRLTLTSQYRSTYLIETSEDLRDWLPMQILLNTTGSASFIDQPSVTQIFRFYRAKPAY